MPIIDSIRADLKQAMLDRDKLRTSTLRLVLSAAKNKEIEKGEPLSDEEMIAVLSSETKKRRESVEEYKKGNREDLAEKEAAEIEILKKYLPEQLSEEEIQKLVKEAIAQTGAAGPKDMGKVMQALMPKVKGRADGRAVSEIVKNLLGT